MMFTQVIIILLQGHFGPTFFLPRGVRDTPPDDSPGLTSSSQIVKVETYDYHPPLPLPDPESPEQSLGDCAICMDAITVDPALRQHADEKSEGHSVARRTSGLLAQGVRKNYSLAPCHHLFVSTHLSPACCRSLGLLQHTACLERVSLSYRYTLLLR